MLWDLFQYGFVIRGFEAGIIVAFIAPLIGIFLVLRRYSLIADTLSHVSLAGIAVGLWLGISPILTALVAAVLASLGIERLRINKKVYGESALAIFLSGGLALAVVLMSAGGGFSASLYTYLFGSIVTVTSADISTIVTLATVVVVLLSAFFKELVFLTFDEEAARVSGIPSKLVNTILILLTAFTIALSIPIVGVLLISALIVLPVVIALQFKKGFVPTLVYAECSSLFSMVAGILIAFNFNLSAGGTIVLILVGVFALVLAACSFKTSR